jgi:hypothetical protein
MSANVLETILGILNVTVEAYLSHVIKPFLTLHEKFYLSLNRSIRNFLDENTDKVPTWFTANFITYIRTIAVVPAVMLLVNDYKFLPGLLILAVDFGDFLDGVVARYWFDRKKIESISTVEGEHSFFFPSKYFTLIFFFSFIYISFLQFLTMNRNKR